MIFACFFGFLANQVIFHDRSNFFGGCLFLRYIMMIDRIARTEGKKERLPNSQPLLHIQPASYTVKKPPNNSGRRT